ncbi:MAG TPA: hypothetical protein VKD72_12505 [Gemmataceae bacterium]|nr:hypothetical protein [Gemmataceae bacterium]
MIRMRANRAAFARIRTRVEALRLSDGDRSGPLLVELDRENIRQVRRAFSTHGATTPGGPWLPWSEEYRNWRKRHHLGRQMLKLTGTMFGKFVSPSHGDHIAQWRGAMRFAFGARDDVAYVHMGDGPRSRMPYRSVIDKTDADKVGFAARLLNFYRKRIRQVLR